MTTVLESEALNIIVTGSLSDAKQIDPDQAATHVIDILTSVAQDNPDFLLKSIRDAVECRIDGMVIVALAILTAKADEGFLKRKETANTIISILSVYGPPKLLEYVEYLKSKAFGKGFGSRPQKWLRTVMEGWRLDTMDVYLSKHTSAYYSLVRLVHPRYHGTRGLLVQDALDLKKNSA